MLLLKTVSGVYLEMNSVLLIPYDFIAWGKHKTHFLIVYVTAL